MITELNPGHLGELSQFLRTGLGTTNSNWFDRNVLEWKYLDGLETNSCPKSFVSLKNGRIVSHVGMTFKNLHLECGKKMQIMHPIDWYTTPSESSAGIAVMLKAIEHSAVQYVIGGTEIAKQAHLALGYKSVGEAWQLERTLTPLHHLLHGDGNVLRQMAKALRDSINLQAFKSRQLNLYERVTTRGVPACEIIQRRMDSSISSDELSVLKRLARYPHGGFYRLKLEHGNESIGSTIFRTKVINGCKTAVIAKCQALNDSPSQRRLLVFWTLRHLRKSKVHSVSTITADSEWRDAFTDVGLKIKKTKEVLLRDRGKLLESPCSLDICPLDADHSIR